MALDLAHRHAARVHRHDLVVETGKPSLIALDQLRIERTSRSRGMRTSIFAVSVRTVFFE